MSSPSDTDLVPGSLRNFDALPDSAEVRLPTVTSLFGISAATVWRRVKDGALPKPRKFGPNTTSWRVGELRAVLAKAAS